MIKYNRGFVNIVVVLLLLGVLTAAGFFLIKNNQKIKAAGNVTSVDAVATGTPQDIKKTPISPTLSSFSFIFTDYEGRLDTAHSTYTDTFEKPNIIVSLVLKDTDLQYIRKLLETKNFFNPSKKPSPISTSPRVQQNPCLGYSLEIHDIDLQNSIKWDCSDKDNERSFFVQYITGLITSSKEYQALPKHGLPQ